MTEDPGTTGLIDADAVLREQLVDPLFRSEWQRLALARAVALRLTLYRADHGLTQTALGRLLDMPQPAIARLESADHVPSFPTLVRLSETLGIAFSIDIRPRSRAASAPTDDARSATISEVVHTDRGADILVAAS
ncbi:MAG: helix-turn-helix transcriptional regulator [Chloroflexia bacterium]|nr:helix-turn-helix transcriptional regulator [Chloroflexia bacterium]